MIPKKKNRRRESCFSRLEHRDQPAVFNTLVHDGVVRPSFLNFDHYPFLVVTGRGQAQIAGIGRGHIASYPMGRPDRDRGEIPLQTRRTSARKPTKTSRLSNEARQICRLFYFEP
ncbi:hypothetical protein [Acanthopleuribacter pedis]|uniref:Uncharacterized protein n=1 Tax=Acanthopleuribacter pedis TaxID=442870 RepID=A0A8J7U7T8_9BACT|nr:hypothetical protein [Acanthopleuribacter pedis]MBO1322873.1 hypothetical protein [Acanthopleuribacter pedis]